MSKSSISLSSESNSDNPASFKIKRRGFLSGYIQVDEKPIAIESSEAALLWKANKPVHLPKFVVNNLERFSDEIAKSREMFEVIAKGGDIEAILDQTEYMERLGERFEMLATRCDDADPQEIVSVDFDVMENGEMIMEDVWMRVSWLSFENDDDSLRFRFSFGMEGYDDVSLDFERQLAAAELCESLFPESAIITEDQKLHQCLSDMVGGDFVMVERIIYFNAPNGGAQFHHDAEKGHLGVVYAQITSETFWLAMSKEELLDEVLLFLKNESNLNNLKEAVNNESEYNEFVREAMKRDCLSDILDNPAHNAISILLNNVQSFFEQLVNNGFGYYLKAGDVMLLPQESMKACAWHSVFCIGDEAGQALSYAIKRV